MTTQTITEARIGNTAGLVAKIKAAKPTGPRMSLEQAREWLNTFKNS